MSPRSANGKLVEGLDPVCETTVYPHVFGHPEREVGGVLIGRRSQVGGLPYVTGAIEAHHAAENRAALTFTQETWEHVHRILAKPGERDERIVGWYHSHPNFGIFLSEHDLFVHRHVFSDPSQIALVVDPVRRSEGVFTWHGHEIAPLFERATPRHWTPAEVTPDEQVISEARRAHPALIHATALLIGLLAGMVLYVALLADDPPRRPAPAGPAPATTKSAPVVQGTRTATSPASPRDDEPPSDRTTGHGERETDGTAGNGPVLPGSQPHTAADQTLDNP